MIIDCVSDLHGSYPKLEGGDLLIVAGDLTARNTPNEYLKGFGDWVDNEGSKYKEIVVIAGNHDRLLQRHGGDEFLRNCTYLQDSGCKFEGLKIWGSPWTPWFMNWHFMLPRGEQLAAKWALIPEDTDILVTHGPPQGILDKVKEKLMKFHEDCPDGHVGCEDLRKRVKEIKPKLHVFGHVHEGYGGKYVHHGELHDHEHVTSFVNCAHMNRLYEPVNKPIRVIL